MKTTHTNGEWKVTTDGQKVTSILDRNDANGFNNICSINEHVEEREANAKLISAAPELLDALVTLKDYCQTIDRGEGWDEIVSKTFKAIEKATK